MIEQRIAVETGLERPTVFISDLHLGDGSAADDFDGEAFAGFWNAIPADWFVVLLGDTLEWWQCGWADVWRKRVAILTAFTEHAIWHRLTVIAGNHDWKLNYIGYPAAWTGGAILAEHGHQADLLNSGQLSWLGHTASWAAGLLERIGWKSIDDEGAFDRAWARIQKICAGRADGKAPGQPDYIAHAMRRLAEVGVAQPPRAVIDVARASTPVNNNHGQDAHATIFIFGHTHKPFLRQMPDGAVIANCGDWTQSTGHRSAIVVYPDEIQLVKETPT